MNPGDEKKGNYYLPIIYDELISDIPTGAVSFGNNIEAAMKWAHNSYSNWRLCLDDDSVDALLAYSSAGDLYEDINSANRGFIPMTKELKNITSSIDKALNVAVLQKETVVYRGIGEEAIVDMALKAGGKLESGIVLEDQGFMSTSLIATNLFTRSSNYILRLIAMPGLHGAPLEYGDLSLVPLEGEMLFGRNHNIYIKNIIKIKRSDLIPKSGDDPITIIDGILTI